MILEHQVIQFNTVLESIYHFSVQGFTFIFISFFQSVIVKSIERNSANMYEARRLLLGLERDPALPPPTKLDNSPPGLSMGNLGMIAPNLLSVNTANTLLLMNGHTTPNPPPPQSPDLSPTSSIPSQRWVTSPSPGKGRAHGKCEL